MDSNTILRSERIYKFILKLYPRQYREEFGEEMQFVFSETLKDSYEQNGTQGIISFWTLTMSDAVISLITQHLQKQKGKKSMKTKSTSILMQNKIFGWIALGTLGILLIPLIGMQYSSEVDWGLFDFIVIGALLMGMGSLFVMTARKIRSTKNRIIAGIVFILAVLYMWAELAVGIFTTLGS